MLIGSFRIYGLVENDGGKKPLKFIEPLAKQAMLLLLKPQFEWILHQRLYRIQPNYISLMFLYRLSFLHCDGHEEYVQYIVHMCYDVLHVRDVCISLAEDDFSMKLIHSNAATGNVSLLLTVRDDDDDDGVE